MAAELEDLARFQKTLHRMTHANLLRDLNKYENEVGDLEKEISEMSDKAYDKERPKLVLKKNRLQKRILVISEEMRKRKTQLA